MSVPVANIVYTDTFGGWIEKTNQLAYVISTNALTAIANSTGSSTTGNAALSGIFTATTIAAGSELRGGSISTPAVLTITSNATFTGTLTNFTSNTAFAGANLTITTTRTTISSANLIVSSVASFSNTVTFNSTTTSGVANFSNTVNVSGNLVASNNVNITGPLSASNTASFSGDVTTSGNTTIGGAGLSVTANTNVTAANVTISGGTINIGSTVSGSLIPTSNNIPLGNTSNRFNAFIATADVTTLTVNTSTTLQGSFANVVSQAYFRANTQFLGGLTTFNSNTTFNAANVTVGGGTFNVTSNTNLNSNVVISGSTLTVGSNTTFNQKVVVVGDLNVSGNLTFASTAYADIIPSSGGYNLGNTSLRWGLFATTGNFSGNLTVTGTTTLTGATVANGALSTTGQTLALGTGVSGSPTTNTIITFGRGSSANAYILWDEVNDKFSAFNGTTLSDIVVGNGGTYAASITGNANTATTALTANNATNFNGQPASYFANATNITSGTLASARLSGTYAITISGTANNATNFNGQAASYYLTWGNFTGLPTTLSGYGITNAVDTSTVQSVGGVKTFTANTVFNGEASFGSSSRQMLNLYGSTYGIGVQDLTTYVRTQKAFSVFQAGTHVTTENDPGTGGTRILLVSNTAFQYNSGDVWHAGNYTPVRTVANTTPNANGDIVLSSTFQAKSANLDIFSVRSIGTATANDVIDRAGGDTRYARLAGAAFTGLVTFKNYKEARTTVNIASNVLTIDFNAAANIFDIPLNQNITSIVFNNVPAAGADTAGIVLRFTIGGTYTIAWPSICKHIQGIAPAISSTVGDVCSFTLVPDSNTSISVYYSGNTR